MNMKQGRIIVAGIGPGSQQDITPAVLQAIHDSDVIIGYNYYFKFIEENLRPGTRCVDTGMKREKARAEQAFEFAEQGETVCIISSGDAGIYGMAPLIYEMKRERNSPIEIVALPGISAFQKAASLLGAPMGHDFCVISLSDLLTPWSRIEKRIIAAAERSEEHTSELHRAPPVGYVRQAGRDEQAICETTLAAFDPEEIDMFTVVIIGNSQSYLYDNHFVTPRGYYAKEKEEKAGIGQQIMIESFRTIEKELKNQDIPLDRKWALLHAIHTTADFEMENLLHVDDHAVENLFQLFSEKKIDTIVTDVTMAASGIRKGALQRLGVEVKCYLSDERAVKLAQEKGITRTQAGIRIAVEEHPNALFVFGNAPTALMELCTLIRRKRACPSGIIAAPVGFVHVCESKHMIKPFTWIPKIIVEGRKGGSNLAATLTNAVLCYDDAQYLRPGRDV